MSPRWPSCPRCHVFFIPGKGRAPGTNCPACGTLLPAMIASSVTLEWYYARSNKAVGLFSSVQLTELASAGALLPSDLVLRSDTQQWLVAAAVPGLFSGPPVVPPPIVLSEPQPAGPAHVASPLVAATAGAASAVLARKSGELISRHQVLSEAQVVSDAARCVQCGIC